MENTRVVYVANTDHEQQGGQQEPLSTEVNNVLPEINNVMPEVNNVMPEVNNVMPEVNNVLPEVNNVLPEVNNVLPEVNNVLPEVNNVLPVDNMSSVPAPFSGGANTKIVDLDIEDEGYESSGSGIGLNLIKNSLDDDDDDNSSICTDNILKVDPIYIKLSKFLQTAEGENVCNILEKILHQLEELNRNMKK
jgi:hypothetical protein